MELINKRNEIKKKAFDFISNGKNGVFLYGINKYSKALKDFLSLKFIKTLAFIDDFSCDTEYDKIPIVKISSLSANDFVINCIVDARPIDAFNKIKEKSINNYSDYFSIQTLYNEDLPQVDYLSDTQSIWNNKAYNLLFTLLADEESKQTLEKVLDFRFNRDLQSMRSFSFRINEQYFESFLSLPANPVFIDGGGFDGQTTKKFIELYPQYKGIHYFEPSDTMMEKSKSQLAGSRNIKFYQKGLWNETAILSFDNTKGSASRISDEVDTKIEVTSIDQIIPEEVDFIKLDIEGAEFEALLGAEEKIKKYKPKLAICVYHNQVDFIRIPELLLSYNPEYKIFLRHYTQGVLETVMFFV